MASPKMTELSATDPWDDGNDGKRISDPLDIPVQLNVRIPWFYREQLIRLARENRISLNRLIANALVQTFPPQR
jgi:hypothetical protein